MNTVPAVHSETKKSELYRSRHRSCITIPMADESVCISECFWESHCVSGSRVIRVIRLIFQNIPVEEDLKSESKTVLRNEILYRTVESRGSNELRIEV